MGENLKVFWKKQEKKLGKRGGMEQSEINPMSKYRLSIGTRITNECDTIRMKEEANEGVNRLLLYYVNPKVICMFWIGKMTLGRSKPKMIRHDPIFQQDCWKNYVLLDFKTIRDQYCYPF